MESIGASKMLCNMIYPGFPTRFPVPPEKRSWEVPFPEYKPVEFTDMKAVAHSKQQQDARLVAGLADAKSFEISKLQLEKETGRPINPKGRTGIRGRGVLWKWGPNNAADPIVTRINPTSQAVEMVAIQRRDNGNWAIPGGFVDPGEAVSVTLKREFEEETLNVDEEDRAGVRILLKNLFDPKNCRPVYEGYVDDPRNTDNSWVETTAHHFPCPPALARALTLSAGDDAQNAVWLEIAGTDKRYNTLYETHKMMVEKAVDAHYPGWRAKQTGRSSSNSGLENGKVESEKEESLEKSHATDGISKASNEQIDKGIGKHETTPVNTQPTKKAREIAKFDTTLFMVVSGHNTGCHEISISSFQFWKISCGNKVKFVSNAEKDPVSDLASGGAEQT
eukprot:g1466.t1